MLQHPKPAMGLIIQYTYTVVLEWLGVLYTGADPGFFEGGGQNQG